MKLLDVKGINTALYVDGPDFIEVIWNEDYFQSHQKGVAPICAKWERTLEWREALSKSCGGVNHHQWGKRLTEEHKKRISDSNKNLTGIRNGKSKIWKITFKNGKIITICGMANWCKENNYNRSHLIQISKGNRKKHKDIVSVVEVAQ